MVHAAQCAQIRDCLHTEHLCADSCLAVKWSLHIWLWMNCHGDWNMGQRPLFKYDKTAQTLNCHMLSPGRYRTGTKHQALWRDILRVIITMSGMCQQRELTLCYIHLKSLLLTCSTFRSLTSIDAFTVHTDLNVVINVPYIAKDNYNSIWGRKHSVNNSKMF